jgi:hypothetical protein
MASVGGVLMVAAFVLTVPGVALARDPVWSPVVLTGAAAAFIGCMLLAPYMVAASL